MKKTTGLLLAQFVNVTPDMIYVLDLQNDKIEFINTRVTDILDYTEEDIYEHGHNIFNAALFPEDYEKRMQHIAACIYLKDGQTKEIDVRLKVKKGGYRWFNIRDLVFKRNADGLATHVTGIIRDIDRQKREQPANQATETAMNNTTSKELPPVLYQLSGGGKMGELIRTKDWSATPLGPIDTWPHSLLLSVRLLLDAPFPMHISWGPNYIQLYNDGYRPMLGFTKHPAALGTSIQNSFAEIWNDFLAPKFADVMRGISYTATNIMLPIDRYNYIEECYFTFSYSPLRDENGQVAGVLTTGQETTAQVIQERRQQTLNKLFNHIQFAETPEQVSAVMFSVLEKNAFDLPFALLYQRKAGEQVAKLLEGIGLDGSHEAAPREVNLSLPEAAWPLNHVKQEPLIITSLSIHSDVWPEPIKSAYIAPLLQTAQEEAAYWLIMGINPRRSFDAGYQLFFSQLTDHLATTLGKTQGPALLSGHEKMYEHRQQAAIDIPGLLPASDNEWLQGILNAPNIGLSVYKAVRDDTGYIVDFTDVLTNPATERTYPEGRIGKRISDKLKNNKQEMETWRQVVDTGITNTYEMRYNAGQEDRWLLISNSKVADGLVHVWEDITPQKKAEEDAKKNLALLQQTESLTPTGWWIYEIATGKFTWSDGMYRLFNVKKGTPVSPSIYQAYALQEDSEAGEKIVHTIQKKFTPFEQTLRIRTDGTVRTLKIKATVYNNEAQQPLYMLGVDADVTPVQAEQELAALRQLMHKENRQFHFLLAELQAYNNLVAHDYQETLRQIYTSLEMIINAEARNFSNSSKAHLRRTQSIVQRLNLLTSDIVAYTRINTPDTEPVTVNLNDLVKKVLQEMAGKIQMAQATVQCSELPAIKGYPTLLSVLFHQLLGNALRWRDEVRLPHIHIHAEQVDATHEQIPGTDPGKSYIKIIIRDNGAGFDPADKEQLFNLFYRAPERNKYKGSATGLAIARKIMHIHEGIVTADCTPGQGTEFCCYFLC